MRNYEIECYTVARATVYHEIEIEARWYGGATVNIYSDDKNVDVYTRYDLTSNDDFEKSFEEYIQEWLKQNEDDDEDNS